MVAKSPTPPDPLRRVVALTLTVPAARQVIWQGQEPRAPIGELLDRHELTYRNLAWAVGAAYRPEVRAAARTLLADWLGQPATVAATQRAGPEVLVAGADLARQEALSRAGVQVGLGYVLGFTMWVGLALLFGVDLRWVAPAVALAAPQPVAHFATGDPPVWLLPALAGQQVTFQTRTGPLPAAQVHAIGDVLRRAAAQQRTQEDAQQRGWRRWVR